MRQDNVQKMQAALLHDFLNDPRCIQIAISARNGIIEETKGIAGQ